MMESQVDESPIWREIALDWSSATKARIKQRMASSHIVFGRMPIGSMLQLSPQISKLLVLVLPSSTLAISIHITGLVWRLFGDAESRLRRSVPGSSARFRLTVGQVMSGR
jgi:hypothetical protein